MQSVFITGIPTSGKSYLARNVSKKLDIPVLFTDDLRKEMAKIPSLKRWTNFYLDQDEKSYFEHSTCDQLWSNLVQQSEAFWPFIKQRIASLDAPHIIEGVTLLPHLMSKLGIPGLVLVGQSEEETFARLQKQPRWGNSDKLMKMEAAAFFNCEGKHYKKEAEMYGFKIFGDVNKAAGYLENLIAAR